MLSLGLRHRPSLTIIKDSFASRYLYKVLYMFKPNNFFTSRLTSIIRSSILLSSVCTGLVGCGNTAIQEQLTSENSKNTETIENGRNIEIWPKLHSPITKDPLIEARVKKILSQMSDEHKVGQIIQPEIKVATPEDVKKYHLGSILNGGGTFPSNEKYSTAQDWVNLAQDYYDASMDTSDGGLAIPVIWGTDAVHGHNNVIGATLFPHNIGLGAANNPDMMREIGRATAKEVIATGITWIFAPTVAAPRNDRWGRTYEGYSEDPAIVRSYAGKIVEGMQGIPGESNLLDAQHVVSTAKHFVGDGGTKEGIDRGHTFVSEKELFEIHAQGYVSAIEAGVQSVMASFNSWNGDRLHGHKYMLTTVLKDRMGFDGFVIGDWNGHSFVRGCESANCPQAFNAGVDLFMAPEADWKELYKNTLAQVKDGTISRERLDDAVTRILRVKVRSGLFEVSPAQRAKAVGKDVIGSDEHRALARKAVRESLVLLKNNNQILPLKAGQKILMAGDGADNIGKQSGGWTLSWQGTGNTNDDFPGGSSIYDGVKQKVEAAGGSIELAIDGQFKVTPDVAIVVFGEDPYAEMQGDRASIEYQPTQHTDLKILQELKAQNIPVVSIFITGRPMWVNAEMNASDAFVVAWLPGSEGVGVSDVLFESLNGSPSYDFSGRLSYSWPKFHHQSVLNKEDEDYDPLFKIGYGLSLKDDVDISNKLPDEFPKVEALEAPIELFVSRAMPPWTLLIQEKLERPTIVSGNNSGNTVLNLNAVDRNFQQDSRRVVWNGNDHGAVLLGSATLRNMNELIEQRPVLVFDAKVDMEPEGSVNLGVTCGNECLGMIELTSAFKENSAQQWRTYSIDTECFAKAGADFSKVQSIFYLMTESEFDLTFANIKLVEEHPANAVSTKCSVE